jgi:hypothetical protein
MNYDVAGTDGSAHEKLAHHACPSCNGPRALFSEQAARGLPGESCGDINGFEWQGQQGSNPRPAVLETAALPTELYPYRAPAIPHSEKELKRRFLVCGIRTGRASPSWKKGNPRAARLPFDQLRRLLDD